MVVVDFNTFPTKVGFVVRGMRGPDADPRLLDQHADCVLSDGSPVGFYGEGPPRTGAGGFSDASNSVGFNMTGAVYDYHGMFLKRRQYVDLRTAKGHDVVSTVLTVNVTDQQGRLFDGYWRQRLLKPGGFDFVGNNCSTHASEAFVVAGILAGSIPGLDTPVHLYRQLVKAQGVHRTTSYTGHVGFLKRSNLPGYQVVID